MDKSSLKFSSKKFKKSFQSYLVWLFALAATDRPTTIVPTTVSLTASTEAEKIDFGTYKQVYFQKNLSN